MNNIENVALVLRDEVKVLPGEIKYNFENVKREIEEIEKIYGNLVLTDEQIKEGTKIRANLNKAIKIIDDFRKEKIESYKAPVSKFEQECKNMVQSIKETQSFIVDQIKVYDEKVLDRKISEVKEIWETEITEFELDTEFQFLPHWELKKNTLKIIKVEIIEMFKEEVERIKREKERLILILEKKEFVEEMILNYNKEYELKEVIRYTEIEQYLELSLKEIKEILIELFETRKRNQVLFELKEKEIELEKVEKIVENAIEEVIKTPRTCNRTLTFHELTSAKMKLMLQFFQENNIKFATKED